MTLLAAGYQVFCTDHYNPHNGRGMCGVVLAVKESLCSMSVCAHQFIEKREMSIRFDVIGNYEAFNVVVAYMCTN